MIDRSLLILARNSIKEYLGVDYDPIRIKSDWNIKRATFVTITKNENLRGCIGSLEAKRTLHEDIEENSISAAFRDPRFFPLQLEELGKIKIEISVLTELKEIVFNSELDILDKIIPNKMGLLLEYKSARGTFLPQVWKHYPDPKGFFNHLKLKAGLKVDFFNEDLKLYYYEVEKCQE